MSEEIESIIPEPEPIVVPAEPELPVESIPAVEPEPVPVVVEPEPLPAVAVEPTPAPAPKPKASTKAAVSGREKDDVFLANCVYKNVFARKSLTVHHVQRRLVELGYKEAHADRDGWLGDLTKLAITNFQKDKGLSATGNMDADTFTKLFDGDSNVNVVL